VERKEEENAVMLSINLFKNFLILLLLPLFTLPFDLSQISLSVYAIMAEESIAEMLIVDISSPKLKTLGE
jgi:hypothetical protein